MAQRTTVAITGATGLLGSYIARVLAADGRYAVRAARRANSTTVLLGEAAARIEWLTGDLRDLDFQDELLRDAEIVVHAAGLVSYKPGDAAALRELNVELTADLVNLSLEAGARQFVHLSSVAAISPDGGVDVSQEQHTTFYPDAATTRYARSKHAAELEVWRGAEEGLAVTVLNPSVVLGGGFWDRSSCRLFGWVDAGQRFYPTGSTGYVDVRDVAAFAKTCIDDYLVGERYILNADNWRYKRFFDAVAEALGVAPPHTPVNHWQAEAAWRAEAARSLVTRTTPLLTRESARRSMSHSAFDNQKSVNAGAAYRPVGETIEEVAALYRATQARGWGVLSLP